MRKLLRTTTALLIIFTLLLCGCASGGKAADTSSSGEVYGFEPVTEIKQGQKNIYVILKVMTSQYWQDIVKGIAEAGKELDCNVYVGGPAGEGDWEGQEKLIDEAVNEHKADAFVIAPANSSMLIDKISGIYKSGTPVVLVDTIINSEDFDTCFMTDNLQAGEYAAKEMLRHLTESGLSKEEPASIAMQIGSTSSQTIIDRIAGFNQYWAVNAPGNWKVLDEVKINDGDKQKAKQNCIDFLEAYPDIKGFFGCNNSSTVGFVNGIKEKNRNDLVLVGFDYADETAELVASDEYRAATMVQNQYDMGYKGLKEAVDAANGIRSEYKFVDTGIVVINRDNYKQYEAEVKNR